MKECGIIPDKASKVADQFAEQGFNTAQFSSFVEQWNTNPTAYAEILREIGFSSMDIGPFINALQHHVSKAATKKESQQASIRVQRVFSTSAEFVIEGSNEDVEVEIVNTSIAPPNHLMDIVKLIDASHGRLYARANGLNPLTQYKALLKVKNTDKELEINFATTKPSLPTQIESLRKRVFWTKLTIENVPRAENQGLMEEAIREDNSIKNMVTMMSTNLFATFHHKNHKWIVENSRVIIYNESQSFSCVCILSNPQRDLVLLQSDEPVCDVSEAPILGIAVTGADYLLLGFPGNRNNDGSYHLSVLEGHISSVLKDDKGETIWLRGSSGSEPGYSGGPIYSMRTGKLLGINVEAEPTSGFFNSVCRIVPLFHFHNPLFQLITANFPIPKDCGLHDPPCKIDITLF
uniref:Uncharacterized protein n=1 Tax=Acrobeloides nanus TaxID=290746 RepID=A0A914DGV4_9BILA